MNKFNLSFLFTFLFSILLFTSCSRDTSTEEFQTNSADYSLEISSENTMRAGSGVVDAKITYYPHVKEGRKQKIRDEYIQIGVLISWSPCPNDPFSDIWIVHCEDCESDQDLPIKTDDCEDEDDACDVARTAIFEPCKK